MCLWHSIAYMYIAKCSTRSDDCSSFTSTSPNQWNFTSTAGPGRTRKLLSSNRPCANVVSVTKSAVALLRTCTVSPDGATCVVSDAFGGLRALGTPSGRKLDDRVAPDSSATKTDRPHPEPSVAHP